MIQEGIILTVMFWVFLYIILRLRDKVVKKKLLKKPIEPSKPIDPAMLQGTRTTPEVELPKLDISADEILKKLED